MIERLSRGLEDKPDLDDLYPESGVIKTVLENSLWRD
jgi:hypothetical protein